MSRIQLLCTSIVVFLFVASGCNNGKQEQAQALYDQARQAYEQKHFNKAKVLLDSIIFAYAKQKEIVANAQKALAIVYHAEQENSLQFLDSLLIIRQEEIKPLMKQFYIEDELSDVPVLIHKKQSAERAYERSYIRAHVSQNGDFYMSSHYTGERPIHHNRAKVEQGDSFAMTDSITNDAYNHSFENDGMTWEVVKYKHGHDNGTAGFVARNADKRLVVTLLGERSRYKFLMTQTDKEAIRDSYYLALLLREQHQIKNQIENVKKMLTKTEKSLPMSVVK